MGHEHWFMEVLHLRFVSLLERRKCAARLLSENLTEQQRRDYELRRYFHVVGGASGRRYRIRHGRVLNVDELGPDGDRVSALCFGPKGGLPTADVMLAQKLALEHFENATLAIAFRYWPNKIYIP